jgi:DNA-directed RNA polymerase subunit RPC12/RpoP
MQEINLDESKIKVDGQWLAAEDLAQKIQERIKAGDLKISGLAEALESLSHAIENSHALTIKLVLTKDEYQRFKSRSGEDDRESVRKAILSYIGGNKVETKSGKPKPIEAIAPLGKVQEVDLDLTLPALPKKEPQMETPEVEKAGATVKCIKCKSPIEISSGADPDAIQCPSCSDAGLLKTRETKATRYQDHFLG